jgi:hypothetical protein
MSNFPLSSQPDDAVLRDALRSLPVPAPSQDFDDRVLAALRVPAPWWQRLSWRGIWQPVQPLLLGTSCSLGLTLLLLHLTLSAPQTAPLPAPAAVSNLAAVPAAPLPSVDALLDRPNLCAGSLAAAWNSASSAGTEEADPEKASRRPEPRRRAEAYCRPALVA